MLKDTIHQIVRIRAAVLQQHGRLHSRKWCVSPSLESHGLAVPSAARLMVVRDDPEFLDQPVVEFPAHFPVRNATISGLPERTPHDFSNSSRSNRRATRARDRSCSNRPRAMRTFWTAVARVKGGSGGRTFEMASVVRVRRRRSGAAQNAALLRANSRKKSARPRDYSALDHGHLRAA
jgi:hypothetical protein